MSRLITGLDIGTSSIKCIVAEQKKNGELSVLSVVKEPSYGFQRGVLVDVEAATQVLRELTLDLQKTVPAAVKNIYANINSAQVRTRVSRGATPVARADHEIQQDDIDKAMQIAHAFRQIPNYSVIHNLVREYFVDDVGNIHDPLGMTGNRLEVSTVIIEAFTPQVNLLAKTLARVGMHVNGFVFNPIASGRTVLTRSQKELGVLLIDFGFHTTSFIIYEEGKLTYTKTIPLGSQHITNDLAVGLQMSVPAAEKLKIAAGNGLQSGFSLREPLDLSEFEPKNKTLASRRFVSEIVDARLAQILELINNELKLLGKNMRFPSGIVVTGGGAKLLGITDFVQKEMKAYVQPGFPDTREISVPNPTHKDILEDPEFSVALGLLLLWNEGKNKEPNGFFAAVKEVARNILP